MNAANTAVTAQGTKYMPLLTELGWWVGARRL
jgi:hypothetical protein